jgi:hypothetical protein
LDDRHASQTTEQQAGNQYSKLFYVELAWVYGKSKHLILLYNNPNIPR